MSTQVQKKYFDYIPQRSVESKRWGIVRQTRLRKLHSMTNGEVATRMSSIPKAKLDMWFNLNRTTRSDSPARHIFYKAIVQSSLACKTRESSPDVTFHREAKAEHTEQIYKQLFCKIDPKLEVSEEICKYLDF